jgi:hypothetical protein
MKLPCASGERVPHPLWVFKGCGFSPAYDEARPFRRALADSIRSSNFIVTSSPTSLPIASRISAFTGSICLPPPMARWRRTFPTGERVNGKRPEMHRQVVA